MDKVEDVMIEPVLYRGQWPQNISKTAKYAVRIVDGKWKITVSYDLGEGLMLLAVESRDNDIAERVNNIKRALVGQEGGVFYINEYRHLIVSVPKDGTSHYYFGGTVDCDFQFEFERKKITPKPQKLDGSPLAPGDPWVGPRPAIPYVLAAGGKDIYFETPALTNTIPAKVRQGVTRKVQLSKVLKDRSLLASALSPICSFKGQQGGRFYVNEHLAIFTPIDKGEGNGLTYTYCGQVDLIAWFPEPKIESNAEIKLRLALTGSLAQS
jgi:hypothetical protein